MLIHGPECPAYKPPKDWPDLASRVCKVIVCEDLISDDGQLIREHHFVCGQCGFSIRCDVQFIPLAS